MNNMTPRDRVLSALHGGQVDRVPVMEMGIDWAVMRGLGYRRYFDMIEGLDLDGVSVNQALYFFGWRKWVIPHLSNYTDEWKVTSRLTGELLPIPVKHPIPDPGSIEGYRPPRPEKNPLLKVIRHTRRRFPDRAITMLSRTDFAASWFLCGMDVLLSSFIENPDFAHALADMVSDYYTEFFERCIEAGVDVIFLTDDYAYKTGTLMSRDHFTRFILPALSRSVDTIHKAGGLCVKHTDGNIAQIADLLIETGVDGIGPLEPAAGNDLPSLRAAWGTRPCLVGNVDVDLLCRGTVAEVSAVTRRIVEGLAPTGGHILSSGNTVTSSVRPENFLAMIETGRSVALG